MSDFLERMRRSSLDRLPSPEMVSSWELDRRPRTLVSDSFLVIAEVKPASPSEGEFPARDALELAKAYQLAGARAISVLTEPTAFGGSLELLSRISSSVGIPVMRKDFLVHPTQITEALSAGADGVLVIARMLDDRELTSMVATAMDLGMFVLIEVFDVDDAVRAAPFVGEAGVLIGVNSRDLATLENRPDAHERLIASLPEEAIRIAESGLHRPTDIERVVSLGFDGVLVGSALMRSTDPSGLLGSMVTAGSGSE